MAVAPATIKLRNLGLVEYRPTWRAMQEFTEQRDEYTPDELWLVEHPPVFTLGKAGKPEHLLTPGEIPVARIDRGGQVTYHGPGQIILYTLIDLHRRKLGVRALVTVLEKSVIVLLREYNIEAIARKDAPGVYLQENGAKIAAVGLRIRKGCSFHGLSFNMQMDLSPFSRINPCGYEGLQVTQLADLVDSFDPQTVRQQLASHVAQQLSYHLR